MDWARFYSDPRIGVAAMAFCFPGTNPKGGDYPPPPRCAALWRARLLAALPKVGLILTVGSYAQKWHMPQAKGRSMTETVAAWREGLPGVIALPHPSWRNTAWLRRNPWFEDEVVPYLRARTAAILAD